MNVAPVLLRLSAGSTTVSIDECLSAKLLPLVLSVIAGSVDIIGFLALGGLFSAHITGNIVVLAAKLVAGEAAPVSYLISVPIFIFVLAMTKLLAVGLGRLHLASLTPLLLLQLLLLAAALVPGVGAGEHIDPNSGPMIFVGMMCVSAMAVQNALVRLSIQGAPSTAVLTTNITLATMDLGELLLGRDRASSIKAGDRVRHTWPAIAGFLLGCALGAACESMFGLQSLALPVGLAMLALIMGAAAARHYRQHTERRMR